MMVQGRLKAGLTERKETDSLVFHGVVRMCSASSSVPLFGIAGVPVNVTAGDIHPQLHIIPI